MPGLDSAGRVPFDEAMDEHGGARATERERRDSSAGRGGDLLAVLVMALLVAGLAAAVVVKVTWS